MTKIKICGLTRMADIDAVNAANPDYIGFVFAESRRRVTAQQAAELRARLARHIIPVGVFVNETAENVAALIRGGVIDMVQLHGTEDEDYIKRLKYLADAPIIKVVAVGGIAGQVLPTRQSNLRFDERARNDQLGVIAASEPQSHTVADYLLFDSIGGGTGRTFDWRLVGHPPKPYFLAGGLDSNNITEALAQTTPFAVDVSSGVETNGIKDAGKIHEFIRRVRNGKSR